MTSYPGSFLIQCFDARGDIAMLLNTYDELAADAIWYTCQGVISLLEDLQTGSGKYSKRARRPWRTRWVGLQVEGRFSSVSQAGKRKGIDHPWMRTRPTEIRLLAWRCSFGGKRRREYQREADAEHKDHDVDEIRCGSWKRCKGRRRLCLSALVN